LYPLELRRLILLAHRRERCLAPVSCRGVSLVPPPSRRPTAGLSYRRRLSGRGLRGRGTCSAAILAAQRWPAGALARRAKARPCERWPLKRGAYTCSAAILAANAAPARVCPPRHRTNGPARWRLKAAPPSPSSGTWRRPQTPLAAISIARAGRGRPVHSLACFSLAVAK
jgi:hypothetical protein